MAPVGQGGGRGGGPRDGACRALPRRGRSRQSSQQPLTPCYMEGGPRAQPPMPHPVPSLHPSLQGPRLVAGGHHPGVPGPRGTGTPIRLGLSGGSVKAHLLQELGALPCGTGGSVRGCGNGARPPPAEFPAYTPSQRPGAHRAGPPGTARCLPSAPGTSRGLARSRPPGCELWAAQQELSGDGERAQQRAAGAARTAAPLPPGSLLKYLSTWTSSPRQATDSRRMA